MALAWSQRLTVDGAHSSAEGEDSGLKVVVVFTTLHSTMRALARATKLAESLGMHVTLVVPQVVPYPLPLTSPPVLLDFQEKRFREIAAASPVEIRVNVYLCRDELETLKRVLQPHSLVIVGGRKRWWPTREKRLACRLHDGHEVIFTETE